MYETHRPSGRKVAYVLLAVILFLGAVGLCGLVASPFQVGNIECVIDRDAIHAPVPHPFHTDGQTVLTRSEGHLPGVCGGGLGKRQNDSRTSGPVLSFRLFGGGTATRGGFSLLGDAFSSYGKRRPHLVLCRLRN